MLHRLFRSDRTGAIIDKRFLMLSYPSRWRYDILRALDYFRDAGSAYDERMRDALDVLHQKRRKMVAGRYRPGMLGRPTSRWSRSATQAVGTRCATCACCGTSETCDTAIKEQI